VGLTHASFLPDAAECAAAWREVRWPDGVYCVACGSHEVECRTSSYRGHLRRYHCLACDKWFSDVTDTALAHSKVDLPRWFYLLRELDKGRPVSQIQPEIGVTYKTALRMARIVREALYEHRDQWRAVLQGEVEADDIHVKGGQQGRQVTHREPRERGLKERGRGTYEGDRPLLCAWVARDGPGTILELRRDAGQHALFASAWRHIEPGARIDTDTWSGYNLLDAAYEHHSVKHSEQYVTAEGVHCNTAEAEWSIFKPWWRQFRGVAKRHLYQYLIQYEFKRTHRDRSAPERWEMMLGFLYVFLTRWIGFPAGCYSPLPVH